MSIDMLYTDFCWTFLESKNKIFKFYLSIDGIFNFNLSFGEFSFLKNMLKNLGKDRTRDRLTLVENITDLAWLITFDLKLEGWKVIWADWFESCNWLYEGATFSCGREFFLRWEFIFTWRTDSDDSDLGSS